MDAVTGPIPDEVRELHALTMEIAEVEGMSPDAALDRALSLLPWLRPYAAAWDDLVTLQVAGVAVVLPAAA